MMVESYIKLNSTIVHCFQDTHHSMILSDWELDKLNEIIPILSPISLITKVDIYIYIYIYISNTYLIIQSINRYYVNLRIQLPLLFFH